MAVGTVGVHASDGTNSCRVALILSVTRWKRMSPVSQNDRMPRAWMLVFLALLIAGCNKPVTLGGTRPDQLPPSRVVSLSPSLSEIISFNGNNGQLVGRTTACNYPTYISTLPVYGGVKPDYEKLAATKGLSLLVYDSTIYSPADIAKLKEVGIPLYEFHSKNLTEFRQRLKDLGKLLEAPLTTSTYLDKIQNAIDNAKAQPPSRPVKVAIMSGNLIAGKTSFLGDVVTTCGGTLAGPDVDRFVVVNPEQLIADNPDAVILAADISQFVANKDKQVAIGRQLHDQFVNH